MLLLQNGAKRTVDLVMSWHKILQTLHQIFIENTLLWKGAFTVEIIFAKIARFDAVDIK